MLENWTVDNDENHCLFHDHIQLHLCCSRWGPRMYDCRLYNLQCTIIGSHDIWAYQFTKLIFMIFLIWHKCHNSKNNLGVRFTEDSRIDFIQSILTWQQGYDIINDQRCLAINFGYKKAIPFPTIKLYPTHDFHLNVGTLGANSLNKCTWYFHS